MAYYPNNPNGQNTMANSAPVVIASDQSSVPIDDNGGSITVDGSVSVSNFPATQPVSGSVSVNNGAGVSAVNIQDGGNSITVDGSVSATVSGSVSVSNFPATQPISGTVTANAGTGTFNISGNVSLDSGTNYVGKVRLTDGITDAEVVPLTGYNAQAVAIVDGSGSQITSFGGGTQYADGAAVATPTGTVALGFDGTNVQAVSTDINGYLNVIATVSNSPTVALQSEALDGSPLPAPNYGVVVMGNDGGSAGNLQLSSGKLSTNTVGDSPDNSPDNGSNPVKIGLISNQAMPLPVAAGNRISGNSDRYGRQLTAQIDPGMQFWDSHESTTIQTGVNIWVPTAGERFVITSLHIATGGTTAGLVTIWGAQTATTVYTPATDQVFFRGVLTPTANATPGALIQPPSPMFSDTTNDCLKITTSTAMTIYIQVYGYEIIP